MSPEQARAEPLDGRSDLYSLGVILYQALAGEVPFRGASAMATVVMHLNSPPPPLQDKAAGPLPEGLADVVMKVLAKDRSERFVDSEDMRAALETVLERAGVAVAQQGRAKSAQARGLGGHPADAATAVLPSHAHEAVRPSAPASPADPTMPMRHMSSAAFEETPWNPPASTGLMAAAAAKSVAAGLPAPELVPKPLPQTLKTVRPRRSTRVGPLTLFVLMTLCGALVWWLGTRKDNESVRERLLEIARVPKLLEANWKELTTGEAMGDAATAAAGEAGSSPQARSDAPRRKGKAPRAGRTGDVATDSAIAATQGGVRKCFARLGSPERDSTRVTVDVSIGADGQVGNVTLRGSGGNTELQTCVEKAVQAAQLPASTATGDTVTWTYDVPLAAADDPAP